MRKKSFALSDVYKAVLFYAVLFLMLLLNLVDWSFTGLDGLSLSFLMAAIYFWTVHRPSLLPWLFVFFLGLLLDFVSGNLVGLNALCLVIMVKMVRGQRRYLLGQSWPVVWAGYCVVLVSFYLIQILTNAMAYGTFMSFESVGMSFIISCLVYPVVMPFLTFFNRLWEE